MGRLRPEEWLARLTGPDKQARKRAVARVCELAAQDSTLVGILREALRSQNDHAVFWIVTHIWSLGKCARVAVPELVRALGERREFGVREMIVTALAEVAPDEPSAKDAIFHAFTDPSPNVRQSALQAVISLANLTAADLARIKEMETDSDEHVASWSEVALRNIRLRRQRTGEPGAADDRGHHSGSS